MAYLRDPGCYRIRCVVTGRQYIGGSTVAVKGRLSDHRKKLHQKAARCNQLMLTDFLTYGEASFRFEIVLRCKASEVLVEEQRLLDKAQRLYNGSRTASHRGPKDLRTEVREQMSRSAKARCTPAFRQAKSALMKQLRAEGRL